MLNALQHAVAYKAEPAHYDAVGETLLWTLEQGLGEAWNEQTADAWGWAFGAISEVMISAGEKAKHEHELSLDKERVAQGLSTEQRKALVKTTWKKVMDSLASDATKLFYERLFQEHPSVKPMFKSGNAEKQAQALYSTISLAVDALDDMDSLVPVLQKLGRQHATFYHVEAGHYDIVGEVLLWTLEQGLGKEWTPSVADAWTWVYGVLASTMSEAGEQAHFEHKKALVQETWQVLVDENLGVDAFKSFYKHLLQENPAVVPLFGGTDMAEQAMKLHRTLSFAVQCLDDMDKLVPELEKLGAAHATAYKAEPAHYDAVGEALLFTLKGALGDAWSADVADAWTHIYAIVSKTMADAGEKAILKRRKETVEATWKAVQDSLSTEATKLFYKRLFAEHPTVIPLFKSSDMEAQAEKLFQTITFAVQYLHDMDELVPKLEELGARVSAMKRVCSTRAIQISQPEPVLLFPSTPFHFTLSESTMTLLVNAFCGPLKSDSVQHGPTR